jgi:hypothetical protein
MKLKFLFIGLLSLFLISCENGFKFSQSSEEECAEVETPIVEPLAEETLEETVEVQARPRKTTDVTKTTEGTTDVVVKPVVKQTSKVFTLDEVDVVPSLVSCSKYRKDLKRFSCSTRLVVDYVKTKFVLDPTVAKEVRLGEVVLEFVVDVDGKVVGETVLSDFGHGSGDQALEIFKSLKSDDFVWTPATVGVELVKTKVFVPISFKF